MIHETFSVLKRPVANASAVAAAFAVVACLGIPPAFAASTIISNVPLASGSGATILPNLLFTLDNSGSMASDFVPDFVAGNNTCLSSAGGGGGGGGSSTSCGAGDPPFMAGGPKGFNGVAYNPDQYYQPAVTSTGATLLASPLTVTAVPVDAYGKVYGTATGSTTTTNITTGITDLKFCNASSGGVCLRNGADATTGNVLAAGTDPFGNALAAGQFPYQTNPSNASNPSVVRFGLPEMMPQGSFAGTTTVTVTTVEAHGLTTSDKVYVNASTNFNATCAAVTAANVNTFSYAATGSGTAANGSYRKCVNLTNGFVRTASTTVTVTSTAHGLVTGDLITTVTSGTGMNVSNVAIVAVDANTFTYTATSGTASATTFAGSWVRTGLYNNSSTANGPAIAYQITPVEYCSDANLTTCVSVIPPATPPAAYPFPAYVRYCLTQAQATAPGAVSLNGTAVQCRSKYLNQSPLPLFTWARYGWFTRDTIQSTVASYSNRPDRTDCAAPPTCTYNEEIQNYARWYAYYQTRILMMKSAVGRAFLPLISNPSSNPVKPDTVRVGFITINVQAGGGGGGGGSGFGTAIDTAQYLRIDNFNPTNAASFYDKFYKQKPQNTTPLRGALSRAGWIFAGKLNTGLTAGIPAADDPVQASCQQNFTLMTTDGFWNGTNDDYTLSSTQASFNVDNGNPTFIAPYTSPSTPMVDAITTGTFDGGVGGVVTTVTPQAPIEEQAVCTGASSTAFSTNASASPQQTTCGCPVGKQQIIERDITVTKTVVTTSGVSTTSTSNVTTFSTITSCAPASYTTSLTGGTYTESKVCTSGTGPAFAIGSGTNSCSCPTVTKGKTGSNIYALVKETISGATQTKTYTNGVLTGTTVTGGTTTVSAGSCSSTAPSPVAGAFSGGTSSSTAPTNPLAFTISPNPTTGTAAAQTVSSTPGGFPDTLADVALYYYETDLRGGTDQFGNTTGPATSPNATPANGDVSANNVPVKAGSKDFATHQHMVTYTIGLADGLMRYQPDYDTSLTGDFANIKGQATGQCFWIGTGPCSWPQPVSNGQSALDDLWHAAVNGRGSFFQAMNATALDQGLQNTLANVSAQVAAASASATTSPNLTQNSHGKFSSTYETQTWSGKIYKQDLDPVTGVTLAPHIWDADTLLLSKVSATGDTRTIYTRSTTAVGVKPWQWANLTATEQGYFNNACSPLTNMTQCSTLSPANLAIANTGSALLSFLRGSQQYEATVFRDRTYLNPDGSTSNTTLGDPVDSTPAYVGPPTVGYVDTGFSTFFAAQASRNPALYVGVNDGMMHAFDAVLGTETWAYVPGFMESGLVVLADSGYASKHRFFTDGTPVFNDVYDSVNGIWRTILVAGANSGGRGYYALDVTDPATPLGLWEFCSDATLCSNSDTDLGLTYGNPIIGKRASDGRWVVVFTSGLNNVSPGSGGGFFYVVDAITGALLNKIPTYLSGTTNAGTGTTPSGLMKISGFFPTALTDATVQFIYGGDQLGNVWRLDLGPATPLVTHVAALKDGSTPPRAQPITSRPMLTTINSNRVIYIGTGRFLGSPDLGDPGAASGIAWQQSLYAFKDKNSDYGTNLRTDTNLVVQSPLFLNPTQRTMTTNPVNWTANDGWMLDFNPVFNPITVPLGDSPGEGVNLVDPKLALGTLIVTTNTPSSGASSCVVGGFSIQYNLDYMTGSYVIGSGGVASNSLGGSIAVGTTVVQTSTGSIVAENTLSNTQTPTSAVNINQNATSVQRFSYRER